MIGQNKLVFEAHPEEYLEQEYRTAQAGVNRIEHNGDYFADDGFNINLKTGAYSVSY